VLALHQRVVGTEADESIVPAVTDSRFYGRYYDIPSLFYGASRDGSHGFDEYVDLESIRRVTKVIAGFIADWCGVEPI